MDRLIDPNFERGRKDQQTADSVRTSKVGCRDSQTVESVRECKDQRTVELVRICKKNSGIHGPPVWSKFSKGIQNPQTADLVQIFKGECRDPWTVNRSEFLKGNAEIHGRSIGPNF